MRLRSHLVTSSHHARAGIEPVEPTDIVAALAARGRRERAGV